MKDLRAPLRPGRRRSRCVMATRYDISEVPESDRSWLLAYNRGDVEATLSMREWLDRHGSSISGVESVVPADVVGLGRFPEHAKPGREADF